MNAIVPAHKLSLFHAKTLLSAMILLLAALSAPRLFGGTVIWSGANNATDSNWSDGLNWTGNATPGTADDVKFFNAGATTYSNIDNIVDQNFTIGSLQYGNTNNAHTTLIANSVTLTITNIGGLVAATPNDPVAVTLITNSITGSQGTLNVTNPAADIAVNQGGATSSSRATLNLSGLGMFNATANRIGVGTTTSVNPGNAVNKVAGVLYLAQTNVLFLSLTDSLANYQTSGSRTNAIEISKNPSNNGGIPSYLYLGQSNMLFVDSIGIGRDKNNGSAVWGWMGFNPAFINNNPIAYFRGVNGPSSRVTWWAVGDGAASASSSNGGVGTNDFTGGTVDALINVLSIGRDAQSGSDMWAGPHRGWLTFTAGTIDANTVIIGNQSLESGTSTTACFGQVNVLSTALLRVNSLLTLGFTSLSTAAGQNTLGVLNVSGGTVLANNIAVGANSSQNKIILSNATLIVTNTIATNATGVASMAMTNSTLGLTIPSNGSLRALVKTLITGGTTNLIQLDPTPVIFSSYPQQFPLIKYTTWNANNFGLASVPGWAPGAMLVSNGVNASLDILFPNDPRPVLTSEPTPYSGMPGDNVTSSFLISISAGSVPPLSYQWYYVSGGVTNTVSDRSGSSNISTISGSTTTNLQILNAQIVDSGYYFVVATNTYGTNTSSQALLTISTSPIAPTAAGPATLTATNGVTTTIVDSYSGSPVPALFWQYNGSPLTNGPGPSGSSTISGISGSTLTIVNPQLGDQGTYSMITSNSAGLATNGTVLTVIVSPTISAQPVNLAVTNTQAASFTVTANGIPAPTYQWYINSLSSPISSALNPSATNSTLTIAHASPSNIANYFVVVQNAAGLIISSNASLTVNSTMGYTTLSPANNGTGICYDTPLYITFTQPPTILTVGKIRIYNVTNSTTPVDTIDLTQNQTNFPALAVNVQAYLIGGQIFTNFPVVITGNTAAIYPHQDLLTSNQTYYVTLDDGTFADSTGAYFAGIGATNAWQFTTKIGGPANPTNVVVAKNGSGDFLTVQGAIDSVPANNTTPTIINIRNGIYFELINVNSKNNLDFRGQSRNGVMIGYPNNNNVYAGAPQRASFVLNGNDCSLETLTMTNMTPSGGSQAEAADVEGSRAIFLNMELDSFQDTFLVHSAGKLVYFQDSLIQGQTDFNWGYGSVYYTNCELRCVLSGGHVTQPRSPYTTNGFGFINCRVTQGYSGTSTFDLGRTISTPTTPSEVLFADCLIDTNCTGYSSDAGTNMSDYSCSNLTATAPAVLTFSQHLTASDPHVIAIQSPFTWLGWQPALAPNIISQPTNVTVAAGQSVGFSAGATGIPAPGYQWLFNGSPITGATSATYNIAAANATNAGTYSVVVNNGSGSVTSVVATLTYVLPTANTATYTRYAGEPLGISITNLLSSVTDPSPNALISLAGTGVSTNGVALVTSSGDLLYQNPNNVADQFSYTVTDGFGGTNSGLVNVVISNSSVFGSGNPAIAIANGTASITYSGIPGYNYSVNRTTNLQSGWTTIWTTNMPAGGVFQFTDPNPPQPPVFYQLLWNWY